MGSTWRMRLRNWHAEAHGAEPQLGDLVYESLENEEWEGADGLFLERGFVCVGVEETRNPRTWRLVLERLDWQDFMERVCVEPDDTRVWGFIRDRR